MRKYILNLVGLSKSWQLSSQCKVLGGQHVIFDFLLFKVNKGYQKVKLYNKLFTRHYNVQKVLVHDFLYSKN